MILTPARVPRRILHGGALASIAVFLACQDSSYITGQAAYADEDRLALNYVMPAPVQETD